MHYTLDTPRGGLQTAIICSYLDRWSSAVGISAPFACVRKSPESLVQTAEGWSPGFCIPHKFPIARPGGKGEKHVYIRDWGMNKVLGTHGKAIRSLAGEI